MSSKKATLKTAKGRNKKRKGTDKRNKDDAPEELGENCTGMPAEGDSRTMESESSSHDLSQFPLSQTAKFIPTFGSKKRRCSVPATLTAVTAQIDDDIKRSQNSSDSAENISFTKDPKGSRQNLTQEHNEEPVMYSNTIAHPLDVNLPLEQTEKGPEHYDDDDGNHNVTVSEALVQAVQEGRLCRGDRVQSHTIAQTSPLTHEVMDPGCENISREDDGHSEDKGLPMEAIAAAKSISDEGATFTVAFDDQTCPGDATAQDEDECKNSKELTVLMSEEKENQAKNFTETLADCDKTVDQDYLQDPSVNHQQDSTKGIKCSEVSPKVGAAVKPEEEISIIVRDELSISDSAEGATHVLMMEKLPPNCSDTEEPVKTAKSLQLGGQGDPVNTPKTGNVAKGGQCTEEQEHLGRSNTNKDTYSGQVSTSLQLQGAETGLNSQTEGCENNNIPSREGTQKMEQDRKRNTPETHERGREMDHVPNCSEAAIKLNSSTEMTVPSPPVPLITSCPESEAWYSGGAMKDVLSSCVSDLAGLGDIVDMTDSQWGEFDKDDMGYTCEAMTSNHTKADLTGAKGSSSTTLNQSGLSAQSLQTPVINRSLNQERKGRQKIRQIIADLSSLNKVLMNYRKEIDQLKQQLQPI